ncbi:membrane protease YdiL (CAAX protease family) [Thermocatellispora tengchongensis]|uniref:Membrane protease YdiL (CAAX protease family) n=1 Tax=Thermocatellispora tengchongensis TaxID=1073253 RepID=A0A840PNF4_9ACTN|nr:CPBP family glutamic-type intramembrane protease [Thermocatellispora tengchongensis]MBB5139311.1 membrane protease YdiL (CAAX protease family) [Thermocatellispora tengchongensis]
MTLGRSLAVLAAANVLNNRVAPRFAPLTSAVATALLVTMARRSGLTWSDLGFARPARGAALGGALAAGVVAVYTAGIALPATRRFFRDERALALSRARVLEEALLQVPIGTVLLEEVGFRGVLYAQVARSHGPAAATAVSSACFGLWHILPAIDMAAANPALGGLAAGEGVEEAPGDPTADPPQQPADLPPAPTAHLSAPADLPPDLFGHFSASADLPPVPTSPLSAPADPPPTGAASTDAAPADALSTDAASAGALPTDAAPADASAVVGAAGAPTVAAPAVAAARAQGAGAAAPGRLDLVRVVAGSVVATAAAGVLFCELRRRGGLLAPSLLHTATNSLGYAFARLAAARDRAA